MVSGEKVFFKDETAVRKERKLLFVFDFFVIYIFSFVVIEYLFPVGGGRSCASAVRLVGMRVRAVRRVLVCTFHPAAETEYRTDNLE